MLQCTNKKWSTRIVFWLELVVCHYSFHLKKNFFLELDIEFLKFQIHDKVTFALLTIYQAIQIKDNTNIAAFEHIPFVIVCIY